jgi:hypothetical protein
MLPINQIEALRQEIRTQLRVQPPAPPQSPNPDEAAAQALAAVLDPTSNVLPGSVFEELARRNQALANAPRAEIVATLSRQIVLLEATTTRFFQKAAQATKPGAAAEFTKAALSAERVLIQALGAIHQMNQVQAVNENHLADGS